MCLTIRYSFWWSLFQDYNLREQFWETRMCSPEICSESFPPSLPLLLFSIPLLPSFLLPFFSSPLSLSYHFLFVHLIDSLPLPIFLPFFYDFSNLQIPYSICYLLQNIILFPYVYFIVFPIGISIMSLYLSKFYSSGHWKLSYFG